MKQGNLKLDIITDKRHNVKKNEVDGQYPGELKAETINAVLERARRRRQGDYD